MPEDIKFDNLIEHMHENMYWHMDGAWLVCKSNIHWQGDDEDHQFRIGKTNEPNQYALVVPCTVKSVLSIGHVLSDSYDFLMKSAYQLETQANKQVKLSIEERSKTYRLELSRLSDQVWELIRRHGEAEQFDRFTIQHKFKHLLDKRESILEKMKGKKSD